MVASGIISLTIILFFSACIICWGQKIKKITIKYSWIVYIIASFCLFYFLIGRFIPDIISYYELFKLPNSEYNNYLKSIYLSKILLLDACPFSAMFLPLSIFIRKDLQLAKILSPLAIIGSLVTLFGQVIWEDIPLHKYLEYLFIGQIPNRMYFMMHLLNLLLGIYVLVVSKKFNLKECIWTFAFYIFWFIYMIILVLSFDIKYNATGLVPNDWIDPIYGEYHKVYLFWKLPFPIITIFWYTIAILCNYLIILIKNYKVLLNSWKSIIKRKKSKKEKVDI